MNPRIFLSSAPVVVFFLLSRVAEPWMSVSGGAAASVAVFYLTRRDRLIGVLSALSVAIVVATAAVGVAWNSERAYLAYGPASDFLFAPLYLASVAYRRPLVGGIARQLFPGRFGAVPATHAVFVRWSYGWAAFDLVHGVLLTTLLVSLDTTPFLVWSRVAGWPLTGAMLLGTFVAIQRVANERRPVAVAV